MKLPGLPCIGLMTATVYAANAIFHGWSPSGKTWIGDAVAWSVSLALLALYWVGYKVLARAPISFPFRKVVLPVIPLVLISFATVPYDSTDAFVYAAVGWAEAQYGMNPYTTVLGGIPGAESDPMIVNDWMRLNKNPWQELPLVYGFSFALLIRTIAWMGHGNFWGTLALFKLINIAAYALVAVIVWTFGRRFGQSRPDIPLYFFAWSPLILLHHIANAHNDLLMGCLIVGAIYLLAIGREIWAPAVLAVAVMIKYLALPLIPLVLFFIVKRDGWRRAGLGAVAMAVPCIGLSLPYIGEFWSFRFDLIASQLNKITAGSLYATIFYVYRFVAPGSLETFGSIVKVLLWTITLGLIAREIRVFAGRPKPLLDDLISLCMWVMFAIVFIGSSQFYSWYIGMLFPLAMLLQPQHWLWQFMILAGGTHVFSLTSLSRKGIGCFLLTTGLALEINRRLNRDGDRI